MAHRAPSRCCKPDPSAGSTVPAVTKPLHCKGFHWRCGQENSSPSPAPPVSGKSTLLACLAGMDNPDGGSVHVAGQRISHRREPERAHIRARHIGMLFQQVNLRDHLTVRNNLALVRSLAGRRGRADRPDVIGLLGLWDRADAYPGQLSGGELARAGLAIALANAPALVLADEPTGELDSATETRVLELLSAAAARGTAVLVASHSPAVAAAATRVIRLTDGRISA